MGIYPQCIENSFNYFTGIEPLLSMASNHQQETDEILRALDFLTRHSPDKVPSNIVHLIHDAISVDSPVAEWHHLGAILQVGREIGVPLHVRWISLDSVFSNDTDVLFPLLINVIYQGGFKQAVVLRKKSDAILITILQTNETLWIKRSELVNIIANTTEQSLGKTKKIEQAIERLNVYGVNQSSLTNFRTAHSDTDIIRLAEFVSTLSTTPEARTTFVRSIVDKPILWSALSGSQNSLMSETSPNGLFAVVAEDLIDYISPTERESHEHDDHGHESLSLIQRFRSRPVERFLRLLRFEKKDILVLIGYSLIIAMVSLVVPLAIDGLVTTISAGTVTLPLIVLSGIVFASLLFSGIVSLIQQYVAEVMKQRIFVNTAFEISQKLPNAKLDFFSHEYAPELVNRFFDVITLQKTFSKILLDGVSAAFTAVAGLFLLAFFSPILLGLGIGLMALSVILVVFVGRGGLTTSIHESHEKYLVAAALEEVGRCIASFKLFASPRLLYNKMDELLASYVRYRREHFKILLRQQMAAVIIKVVVTVSVLVVGGLLVIDREISLGQLVASQIVIMFLISGVDSLFKQLENIFDMLTSLEKLAQVTEIEQERIGGTLLPHSDAGMDVLLKNVSFAYDTFKVLSEINLHIKQGERFCLVGKSGEGKSTLASLLIGMEIPTHGSILLDDHDIRTSNLQSVRSNVGIALANDEIIEGTIYENITMGREWITPKDVLWALQVVRLDDALLRLPKGLQTRLIAHGRNLSTGQVRRIMLARAIVHRPRLLILDESFNGIEENIKLEILNVLHDRANPWTIVSITHDPEVVVYSERIGVLENGKLSETGTIATLNSSNSLFKQLFPDIEHQLMMLKQ
jgi:ABC-type bacteriocin/lantibiotic exporter with double-glycine peptidase domain